MEVQDVTCSRTDIDAIVKLYNKRVIVSAETVGYKLKQCIHCLSNELVAALKLCEVGGYDNKR